MRLSLPMVSVCAFILSVYFLHTANAQEQLGLKLDNYSGVNSLLLNPAATANSPLKWDVNLIAVGHFTENNYGFIQKTKLSEILRNTSNIVVATDIDAESPIGANDLVFDFFHNNEKKHLYTLSQVMGPSIMIKNQNGHAFSLYTAVKASVSAHKIPSSLGYYNFINQDFYEGFEVAPFKATGMTWGEIALNYAKNLSPDNYQQLSIGVTVKALLGFDAFSLENKEAFSLERLPQNSLRFSDLDVAFGLTRTSIDDPGVNTSINGKGAAVDLGFTYVMESYESEGYQQKYSVALIDLGRIFFNQNTELHTFNAADITEITTETYDNLEENGDFFAETSQQILNDPTASLSDTKMAFWLPAAISLQADYKIVKHLFLNALMVRRIPLPGATLQRSNLWAVTPRFETRWLGVSIPVSFYEDSQVHFGAALRLGPLTVGTENLSSILVRSDFTGTDIYAALKINPLDLNYRKRNKRGKTLDCYEF